MAHLNCPRCNGELSADDFTILGIAPASGLVEAALDIICDCPHCGAKINPMVPQGELRVL